MNVEAQDMFIERAITSFTLKAKRARSTALRVKSRWTIEDWEKNADIAAMFTRVLEEARTTSLPSEQQDLIRTAYISGCDWPKSKLQRSGVCCNINVVLLVFHPLLRDYFGDVEGHLSIKSVEFQLSHLAVWAELVAPKLASSTGAGAIFGSGALDVDQAEENAVEAGYREMVARIASDETEMLRWRLAKCHTDGRRHVLMVQHHREQNTKGTACTPRLFALP